MKLIKHASLISFCLITACTPPQQPSEVQAVNKVIPVEKRNTETATISSWEIQGALAAKSQKKGWSATMNWAQKGPNAYQIRLMGPLGGGAVVINKTGNTITFKDGSKSASSTNADELLMKQTGIRLPVNNLYYWVRGLAAPEKIQSEQRDQFNHLTQLKQSGFTITFNRYTSVKNIDLPSVIRLEGNGVMIKVIIKNWSV